MAGHSTEGRGACGVGEETASFGEGEGSAYRPRGRVLASRGEGKKAASPLRDFVLKYVDSCSGKEFKGVFTPLIGELTFIRFMQTDAGW